MTLDELIVYLEDYRAKHPRDGALEVCVECGPGLPIPLRPTLELQVSP